jgi:hypothetical protein
VSPIGKEKRWSRDDLSLLVKLSVDDFYRIFQETTGTDLNRVIRASLDFDRIVDPDFDLKAISANAREALIKLGKGSRINRLRLRKYGIDIGD